MAGGDQMALYNSISLNMMPSCPEFQSIARGVISLSYSAWCHEALVKARRLHFPLACAVRLGSGWRGVLELPVTDCDESWSRRHPG
jgi:hypothetical protein